MKFQIMSDLHLEFGPMEPNFVEADALILAGDILVAEHLVRSIVSPLQRKVEYYDNFLSKARASFDEVIFVLGNHEHYKGNIRDSVYTIKNKYPWMRILDNQHIDLHGMRIWGGTMWTNMDGDPMCVRAAQDGMNDFRIIQNGHKKWTARDSIQANIESLESLRKADPDIVISHHAPSWASIHEDYKDNLMNGAYANSLDDYICNSHIKLWVHGHMHNNSDYMVGNTRVVCNPRGYVGHELNPDFNPTLVLEVPE